jgi:hypothetical protein
VVAIAVLMALLFSKDVQPGPGGSGVAAHYLGGASLSW